MTQQTEMRRAKQCRHTVLWFTAFMLCLIVLYSLIWFYFSAKLQQKIDADIALKSQKGIHIECINMGKTGYPLRIGASCQQFVWQQPQQNLKFTTHNLRVDAPLYAPHLLRINMQDAAQLTSRQTISLQSQWDNIDIRANYDEVQLERVEAHIENLDFAILNASESGSLMTAGFMGLTMKHAHNSALISLRFDNLSLNLASLWDKADEALQFGSGNINMLITDIDDLSRFIMQPVDTLLTGHDGFIENTRIEFAPHAFIVVSGPFSIAPSGLISAKLQLAVSNPVALQATLTELMPEQRNNLRSLFFALHTMPKNDRGHPIIPITLKEGALYLSFFQIGTIAPLSL